MRHFFFVLALALSIGADSVIAQDTVTVESSSDWFGHIHRYNIDTDAWEGVEIDYNVPDLVATATSTSLTLEPNTSIWTDEADNPDYFDQGASDQTPVVFITATTAISDNSYAGEDLTLSLEVTALDLDPDYTAKAYIQANNASNGALEWEEVVILDSIGPFTVFAPAADIPVGENISYGFALQGPLADPNGDDMGSIVIQAPAPDDAGNDGDSNDSNEAVSVSDFQTFQITDNNEIFITTHFNRALDSLSAVNSADANRLDFVRVTEVDGTFYIEEDIQLVVDSMNVILGASSGDDTSDSGD